MNWKKNQVEFWSDITGKCFYAIMNYIFQIEEGFYYENRLCQRNQKQ